MEHVNCEYTRRTHDVNADFASPHSMKIKTGSFAFSHANEIELIHPAASTTYSDANKEKNRILGVNLNLYVIRKIKCGMK